MRVFHVYSKTDCPWCKRAVSVLQKEKEHFTVTVLDHAPAVLKDLSEEFSWKTVPIITLVDDYDNHPIGARLIGGCEDLERFLKGEDDAQKVKAEKAIEAYEKNSRGEEPTTSDSKE
jgi:glutaredoxin 3